MKILTHVDLGKAFESLKNTLIEIEKDTKEQKETVLDTGLKYAGAYGRLSAAVLFHIANNTDTSYHFVDDALKSAEKAPEGYPEAPTLLLHEQTHWNEETFPDITNPSNIHP